MDKKIQDIENKFADEVAQIMYNAGLNGFLAQIYFLLFFSDRPLSLDEIVDKLKVSKGNVSVNIRILESWGAVRPILIRGSRKDHYEANLDIKKILLSRVKDSLTRRLSHANNIMQTFKDELKGQNNKNGDRTAIKLHQDRMKRIEDLGNMARKGLKIIDAFFI